MVSITVVSAHCWMREMSAFAGIFRVLIYDDYIDVKNKLKDILKAPSNVFDFVQLITETNLDKVKPNSEPSVNKTDNPEKSKDDTKSTKDIESTPNNRVNTDAGKVKEGKRVSP